MANNGYITSKKNIDSFDMMEMLNEINERRFHGKLSITSETYEDGGINYFVNYTLKGESHGIYFWKESPKKLAVRRPYMPFSKYLFYVFGEDLGLKMNAIMSDEGIDEKWKPSPGKYPKYKDWLAMMHGNIKKKEPEFFKKILESDMQCIPPEFHDC